MTYYYCNVQLGACSITDVSLTGRPYADLQVCNYACLPSSSSFSSFSSVSSSSSLSSSVSSQSSSSSSQITSSSVRSMSSSQSSSASSTSSFSSFSSSSLSSSASSQSSWLSSQLTSSAQSVSSSLSAVSSVMFFASSDASSVNAAYVYCCMRPGSYGVCSQVAKTDSASCRGRPLYDSLSTCDDMCRPSSSVASSSSVTSSASVSIHALDLSSSSSIRSSVRENNVSSSAQGVSSSSSSRRGFFGFLNVLADLLPTDSSGPSDGLLTTQQQKQKDDLTARKLALRRDFLSMMQTLLPFLPLIDRFLTQQHFDIVALRGTDIPVILSQLESHADHLPLSRIVSTSTVELSRLPTSLSSSLASKDVPSQLRADSPSAVVMRLAGIRDALLSDFTSDGVMPIYALLHRTAVTLAQLHTVWGASSDRILPSLTSVRTAAARSDEVVITPSIEAIDSFVVTLGLNGYPHLTQPQSDAEKVSMETFIKDTEHATGVRYKADTPENFMQDLRGNIPSASLSPSSTTEQKALVLKQILLQSSTLSEMLTSLEHEPGHAAFLAEYSRLLSAIDHVGDPTFSSPCSETFQQALHCVQDYLSRLDRAERDRGAWPTFVGRVQDFLWDHFSLSL